jgi:hypothetical protein
MRCPRCRTDKPLDAFHNNRTTASGRQLYCKECWNSYNRTRMSKPETRARQDASVAKWLAANPALRKAYSSCSRAKKRADEYNANVAWADPAKIKAIYVEAGQRNAGGEDVHVDHIVPLKHDLVCGLHVEANLEIVPATLNRTKRNRHWPDMG